MKRSLGEFTDIIDDEKAKEFCLAMYFLYWVSHENFLPDDICRITAYASMQKIKYMDFIKNNDFNIEKINRYLNKKYNGEFMIQKVQKDGLDYYFPLGKEELERLK